MDVKPFREAIQSLSGSVQNVLLSVPLSIQSNTREIRLRREKPIVIHSGNELHYILRSGGTTQNERAGIYVLSEKEMEECFRILCEYSIHSYENEIQQGYITVKGGHRAGICGTAILHGQTISGLKDISSINLRVARQVDDAASSLMQSVRHKADSMLIIGPPASGKTTLLKDIVKKLSINYHTAHTVAVVDSRGEIAATYRGVAQNNLGTTTDVLDGYPKGSGMMIAIRTLSPDIIVCDEIGGSDDADAIAESLHAGVRIIATAHAASTDELMERQHIVRLLQAKAFTYIVVLEGREHPGLVKEIVKAGDLYDKSNRNDFDRVDDFSGGDIHVNGFVKKSPANRTDSDTH